MTALREILVMKRSSGYLRLHLPPLLYVPALASTLEKALVRLPGVRRVEANRSLARISIFYDPWLTDDRPALLEIDRQATPLLDRMDPEAFTTALVEQRDKRRMDLAERGVRVGYLGLLLYVHYWVIRAALRNPFRLWWVWLLVALAVWIHRNEIRKIKALPSAAK
jgi:hypothetical protein